MNKVKITILTVVAALSASQALADNILSTNNRPSAAVENTIKPYMVIGNYPEDRERVFMFFSFNCPYCNQTWVGMDQWGNTLPRPFRFVPVPVITNQKASRVAATSYYIVRELAPSRLAEFKRQAYALGQSGKEGDGRGYAQILLRMGFKPDQIEKAANAPVTLQRIERAIALQSRYNVRLTPSFGVGGKYLTHAGYTNGKYELVTQLLNALVSQIIEDGSKWESK